ncbi:hypothetical protein MIR68_005218 [Amoeboaphelidium protococcarum]|nr:hypothetical protein MIR68_005218 [Amoeboaphelidium protococcarum]
MTLPQPQNVQQMKQQQQRHHFVQEQGCDELDHITVRDIAAIRYKRNHVYMDEILSPLSVSDLNDGNSKGQNAVPHKATQSKQQKLQQIQAQKDLLHHLQLEQEQLKQQHSEKVSKWQQQTQWDRQMFEKLDQVDSLQQVQNLGGEFAAHYQYKVVPSAPIIKRQIKADATEQAQVPEPTDVLDDLLNI